MRRLLGLGILAGVLASSPPSEAVDADAFIQGKLRAISESDSSDGRVVHMQRLASFVERLSPSALDQVSDASIDGIARLLSMDGDIGSYHGAIALGQLSCRSERHLPQLKALLAAYEPEDANTPMLGIAGAVSPRDELFVAVREIEACVTEGKSGAQGRGEV